MEAGVIQEISFHSEKIFMYSFKTLSLTNSQFELHFADTASFLEKLKKANKSAVIFSVTDPKPQPKLSGPSLPQVLPHLYNTDNVILSPDELNAKCIHVFKDMTVSDTFFMNNLSMKFEMLIKLKC